MTTKIFLVTLSFGLGMGIAQMYTDQPANLLANIVATGATLTDVTITPAK